jgi:hypothetical protein
LLTNKWSLTAKLNGVLWGGLGVLLIAYALGVRSLAPNQVPSKPASSMPTLPSITAGQSNAPIEPRRPSLVSLAAKDLTRTCVLGQIGVGPYGKTYVCTKQWPMR